LPNLKPLVAIGYSLMLVNKAFAQQLINQNPNQGTEQGFCNEFDLNQPANCIYWISCFADSISSAFSE
ncbi:MAG: hypothetical protein WBO96_06580, partial [Enterococcus aquimarinus]